MNSDLEKELFGYQCRRVRGEIFKELGLTMYTLSSGQSLSRVQLFVTP